MPHMDKKIIVITGLSVMMMVITFKSTSDRRTQYIEAQTHGREMSKVEEGNEDEYNYNNYAYKFLPSITEIFPTEPSTVSALKQPDGKQSTPGHQTRSQSVYKSTAPKLQEVLPSKRQNNGIINNNLNTAKLSEEGQTCSASSVVKHFIMNKIEKTGTTTLFSLFTRYIWRNSLNVLTTTAWHIDWTKKTLGNGWLIGPNKTDKAETIICHARYNESIYDKYFVHDYRYLVPVRHPVSWFQSALFYFANELHHMKENDTVKTIMDDKLIYRARSDPTGIKSYFHLPQLQWLGLDYNKHKNNITAIKEYIEWITPKIDLPILNDQFDASLIVLRRRFCWNYTDIFYGSKNVQHRKPVELPKEALTKLLSADVNLGELLLYQSLNQTWWNQPEVKQADFWEEVDYFKKLNVRVSQLCRNAVGMHADAVRIKSSRWHHKLEITSKCCEYLHMDKDKIRVALTNYARGSFVPEDF